MKPSFWEKRQLIRQSSLSIQLKWLLTVLADYCGDDEWCFPSQATLSADLSMTDRNVRRLVRTAVDGGLIEKKRRSRSSNMYRILWNALPDTGVRTEEILTGHSRPPQPDTDVRSSGHSRPVTPDTDVLLTQREHKDNTPVEHKRAPAKSNGRFIKPTSEEVADYCQSRNNGIDPEKFVNYYESIGWMVGGKAPMKNWKKAIQTWEKRDKEAVTKHGSFKTGTAEWKRKRQEAESNDAR